MAKTYCSCVGNRGMATRCGGRDGCRVSCQSYSGSVIVYNWYDENDNLRLRVGTMIIQVAILTILISLDLMTNLTHY